MLTQLLHGRTARRLPGTVRVVVCGMLLAGAGLFTALRDGGPFGSHAPQTVSTASVSVAEPQVLANASSQAQDLASKLIPATGQGPRLSNGTLMICGGGHLPDAIRAEFCKLAGGPKANIVVIPTATSNANHPEYLAELLEDWKATKVNSVQLLHTRSRETANDPDFVEPLAQATGVWMTGGDQCYLTDAYLGTAVQAGLREVLNRGGVVAGTSAGAAVMSGVMITGGQTKADVGQGFDFIEGAIIDQHFLKRNRMDRLIGVLAAHPNLVGLGIDEGTALLVNVRDHQISVLGDSYVVACSPDGSRQSVRLQFLKSGDSVEMAALAIPADVSLDPDHEQTAGVKSAEGQLGMKLGAL